MLRRVVPRNLVAEPDHPGDACAQPAHANRRVETHEPLHSLCRRGGTLIAGDPRVTPDEEGVAPHACARVLPEAHRFDVTLPHARSDLLGDARENRLGPGAESAVALHLSRRQRIVQSRYFGSRLRGSPHGHVRDGLLSLHEASRSLLKTLVLPAHEHRLHIRGAKLFVENARSIRRLRPEIGRARSECEQRGPSFVVSRHPVVPAAAEPREVVPATENQCPAFLLLQKRPDAPKLFTNLLGRDNVHFATPCSV